MDVKTGEISDFEDMSEDQRKRSIPLTDEEHRRMKGASKTERSAFIKERLKAMRDAYREGFKK